MTRTNYCESVLDYSMPAEKVETTGNGMEVNAWCLDAPISLEPSTLLNYDLPQNDLELTLLDFCKSLLLLFLRKEY